VAEVRTALRASNLCSNHSVRAILNVFDRLVVLGFIEARPPAVGIELGV